MFPQVTEINRVVRIHLGGNYSDSCN